MLTAPSPAAQSGLAASRTLAHDLRMNVLTQGLTLASTLAENHSLKVNQLLQHADLTSPWRHPSTSGQSPELWERGEPFSDV